MSFFLKASVLVFFFAGVGLAKAEQWLAVNSGKEPVPAHFSKETALPESLNEELHTVTLDDVIKQVMQDPKNKVLAAKTEVADGKKIHVVKILTSTGHIQHIKIDAATGKAPDNVKK